MASKKDKFGKKVRRSLKKSLGEAPASDKPSASEQGPLKDSPENPLEKPVLDSFALYGFSPAKNESSQKKSSHEQFSQEKSSDKKANQKELSSTQTRKRRETTSSASLKKKSTTKPSDPTKKPQEVSNEGSGEQEQQQWLQVETEQEFGLPRGSHGEKSHELYPKEKNTRRRSAMPRNRDSIYNVSTDIRLEDYTEDSEKERDYAGMARFAAGVLLVALLAWGGYEFSGLLFRPDYQIAITNEEVDAGAVEALDQKENIVLTKDRPVFIRFQWPEGALTSDYLRIRVLSAGREVAVMGRMAPVTVNYILFAGSLEPGKYEIVVENRDGSPFLSRKVTIR